MKTYFTLFIVAFQSVVALAQDNEKLYMTKSLTNDAISSVIVTTSAGGIKVSGKSGEAPRVEVYIQGNNGRELSKEEIQKRLDEDYDMNIAVNGHELSATVKMKHRVDNWRNQMSISFKIYVPEQVSTNLKTSGGGIELDNLKGNENFTTSGGGLSIDKVTGMIYGRTSGGGIEVTNSSDNIDLTTSGGGIEARDCTGKIRLVTSGGGLQLNNLKGDIYAHTSGGGVEGDHIEGDLETGSSGGSIDLRHLNCSLHANTSAGSLHAQMAQVNKYIRLSTSSGDIDLELPAKQGLDLNLHGESVTQNQFNAFNGDWDKTHVRGTVNGGGASVDASASGDINVKFN